MNISFRYWPNDGDRLQREGWCIALAPTTRSQIVRTHRSEILYAAQISHCDTGYADDRGGWPPSRPTPCRIANGIEAWRLRASPRLDANARSLMLVAIKNAVRSAVISIERTKVLKVRKILHSWFLESSVPLPCR